MEMGRSTAQRKHMRWHIAAAIGSSLVLQACASDSRFLRDGDVTPDTKQLETDSSGCREFGPLVAGFFGGAAYGAAQGAMIGVTTTAATGPAAAIGGAAGALIGVIAGAVVSADGDGFDRCMAQKGYHVAQS
jgi:hypothetical protein